MINFALVIHNHQPIDNDTKIVQEVYARSYLPFLERLSAFPSVKANLHYTGYLLDWIEREHPEAIELIRRMLAAGQIEFVGGGYYEPILATIPDADARGQIWLLRDRLKSLFGANTKGIWMAERAWEPQLPEVLQSSGTNYTLLDDTIFTGTGIPERECLRPYMVESRGSSVTVFPILKSLRRLMPWKSPQETIEYLRKSDDGGERRIAVYGDDGEKFGAWPNTYESVYGNRWLEKFLDLLVRNQRWLNLVTLSEYLAEFPARDTAYLPASSYDELLEWSKAVADPVSPGKGFWRVFLAKYRESGRMYAKMIATSQMVHELGLREKEESLKELWKGQCNDAFWHGMFGGIYAPQLRRTTYHHLILAQRIVEAEVWGSADDWVNVKERPLEGRSEYIADTRTLGVTLSPDLGGSIPELDYKPLGVNLFDTIVRRTEKYHAGRKIGKRSHAMVYDRYPKFSFMDYLVSGSTGFREFALQDFQEIAEFANQAYGVSYKETGSDVEFQLSRTEKLATSETEVAVAKTVRVASTGSEISVGYGIETTRIGRSRGIGSAASPLGRFAVEMTFGSLGDEAFARDQSEGPRMLRQVKETKVVYPGIGLAAALRFSRPLDVWLIPIKTLSQSEAGFQETLQGLSVVPNVEIASRGSRSATRFEVELTVQET